MQAEQGAALDISLFPSIILNSGNRQALNSCRWTQGPVHVIIL